MTAVKAAMISAAYAITYSIPPCSVLIDQLEQELDSYDRNDGYTLLDLHTNILDAINITEKKMEFLDWAVNFRYGRSSSPSQIMVHYHPS